MSGAGGFRCSGLAQRVKTAVIVDGRFRADPTAAAARCVKEPFLRHWLFAVTNNSAIIGSNRRPNQDEITRESLCGCHCVYYVYHYQQCQVLFRSGIVIIKNNSNNCVIIIITTAFGFQLDDASSSLGEQILACGCVGKE